MAKEKITRIRTKYNKLSNQTILNFHLRFHVKHFKEDFKIKKILILKQQYKNDFYINRSIICSTWNIKTIKLSLI
ncbi:hypothetical protein CCAN11_1670002 [Capnocytophaga canimorsus]|uniref:Uncharacterized protein n=1 Tax=Capnocytophaga canimorsus TaxID=28188 RepID=A0A0B7IE58_9FLAO|nr:hypothetical protein CCAN11_1670002 [Capnocytophaga canimorsus]